MQRAFEEILKNRAEKFPLTTKRRKRLQNAYKVKHLPISQDTPFSAQKWDVTSKEDPKIRRSLTLKAKASLVVAVVITAMIVIVLVLCFGLPQDNEAEDFWPTSNSPSKLGIYKNAAVAVDSAPCAAVSREILENGGTAVDAAIAAVVCIGANNPQSSGLGGGFLMLYYNRTEKLVSYLDAREIAPRKANETMYENKTDINHGGLAIAVPGELAGLVEAHRQFGKYPWKDLFNRTIQMCKEGIVVSHHLANAIYQNRKRMEESPSLGQIFLKENGDYYRFGERIKRPDLAQTLQTISEEGMRALYGPSEMAERFLEDIQKAGSIIDRIDLQSYSPRMREAVKVDLRRNTTLYSVSLPGSGPLLGFMMNVLDGYEDLDHRVTKSKKATLLYYHRLVETFKYAYAMRGRMEDDDSDEMENVIRNLISKKFANEVRELIDDRTYDESHYGEVLPFVEDHGTAHISIVAPNGDAVAVTSTINTYFGSKIVSPSTGIILNDEMDDFSIPNVVSFHHIKASKFNRIHPGRRPFSSMCPMIAIDAYGEPKLVLGAAGGTAITTGIVQVAARVLFLDEDIKVAIDAPRIHNQLTPNQLQHEKCFPKALQEELRKRGHNVTRWTQGMMSVLTGVMRGENGLYYANSDFRKEGAVEGF